MKRMTLAIAAALLSVNCLAQQVQAEGYNADNTKKNSKVVNGDKPTAENQSNDKASVERSADLRKAILKKKGLSVNAQNIKLIDENGKLTLRGPVDNEKEKSIIESLAKNCYGKNFVSEIEIVIPK
jgi:osmotically-inducible protein OsmY